MSPVPRAFGRRIVTMSNISEDYEVALLGAGFGASLLAAILSKQGRRVCLIDSSRHPRFTIGESSTPAADFILSDLCARYELKELMPLTQYGSWREKYPEVRCGCKRGFSYLWHGVGNEYRATTDHEHELLVAANSSQQVADTQWYRPHVDQFLCQYAQECGSKYYSESTIQEISRGSNKSWTVGLNHIDQSLQIHTPFLIDATGPAAVLLKHLQIEDISNQLKTCTVATYSHYENVPLVTDWLQGYGNRQEDFPYPVDDAAVHHLFADGWLWQLRFTDGLTSLGFVQPVSKSGRENQDIPSGHWEKMIKRRPVLKSILGDARLASFPGKVFHSGQLQRLYQQAAGDGWAALPFTVGFVDPLHSTGIAHTLSAVQKLAQGFESRAMPQLEFLMSYSDQLIHELIHVDRLVSLCYENLSSFNRFSAATMLYFAAATTFEKQFHSTENSFLCAENQDFVERISRVEILSQQTASQSTAPATDEELAELFSMGVQEAIQPFNHVGLFSPQIQNMYHHTIAQKSAHD
ncbi:tryptophan 7-halogenase [uncultured Rubinisphaera sp.]|uniref:NAD(P)/FAD-dependent oxidoreductase n=1 Tax=uncultured Rubinisphaera sp. TaxID=1678686 RepID=UPI0030D9054D